MPEKRESITGDIRKILQPEVNSTPQLIIFSKKSTIRLKYVLDFIFRQSLQISYTLTSDQNEFKGSNLAKLNYSVEPFDNSFQVFPSGFLNEEGVRNFIPDSYKKNGLLYFFSVNGGNTEHDIFSAIFYCISRYEEWLPYTADKHNRFELNNSIFFKNGFHKIPVVDHWVIELRDLLRSKLKNFNFPERKYQYISTIDVDNVYAYKAKPWYRVGGALLKDLAKLDLQNFSARIKTVCFGAADPFDAYDLQIETAKQSKTPLIYLDRKSTRLNSSHRL